jgi:hypothetical protein
MRGRDKKCTHNYNPEASRGKTNSVTQPEDNIKIDVKETECEVHSRDSTQGAMMDAYL